MKKIVLVLVVLSSSLVFSQRIQKDEKQINAGIGFTSGWGIPLYGGFDYGITDDITVGLQASYASRTNNFGTSDVKGTWFGLGANGNYHFNNLLDIPNKWDVYAGLTLAYNSFSWDYPKSLDDKFRTGPSSGVGLAGQAGVRYFFSDTIGVNLEFGGGNIAAGGKAGITFKL